MASGNLNRKVGGHFTDDAKPKPDSISSQAYLASQLYKLPINNKMAVFGATPSGARFVHGQAIDWHNMGGKIIPA